MKLLIASDIHGDLDSAKTVIEAFKREKCTRILLLGDLLYHGPRNDLPSTYAPKEVISLLNEYKDIILTVRGNCDTEVDQMVLSFPILADYSIIFDSGLTIFATHGHHHNTQTPPPLNSGDILLHGHTHVQTCEQFGDSNYYIEKTTKGERTSTSVRRLDEKETVNEVARIIAGNDLSDAVVKHAKELRKTMKACVKTN